MPLVSRSSSDLCSDELNGKKDGANDSPSEVKEPLQASTVSSAVGNVATGQIDDCVLAGAEAAQASVVCSESLSAAGAASSTSREPRKDGDCDGSTDDVEMVDVQSGAACSGSFASDDSLNFYDDDDQDYRQQPWVRNSPGVLYTRTYTYSHDPERPGYYSTVSSYHPVNMQVASNTSRASAVVDKPCFEGADGRGTTTGKKEQINAFTSVQKPTSGSAIRQLTFDDEVNADENASAKEYRGVESKTSSAPLLMSPSSLLQSLGGEPLTSVSHVHSVKSYGSDLELGAARAAASRSSFVGESVDRVNEPATFRLSRGLKKLIKRQSQTTAVKVTAEQLPGYVGDRDIEYLVDFVEGSLQERGGTNKAVNGVPCETKRNKKKDKCKKIVIQSSEKPMALDQDVAASPKTNQNQLATNGSHAKPENVTADLILDATDMSSIPVSGSDDPFLVVDRKKKRKIKPTVSWGQPVQPAVSGLPSCHMPSSITFGSEHSSFVLLSSERGADSSSCTDDMRSEADGDAYPSLVRLPPVQGASVFGIACDDSSTSSLTDLSGSSKGIGKENPPKASWAAVAARGLLGARGAVSAPETAGGFVSNVSKNTDSIVSNSREHADAIGSRIGCSRDVGSASGMCSKLDESHGSVGMPLPCAPASLVGNRTSDSVAVIGVAAPENDVSSLSRLFLSRGVEFVGVHGQLFLSRSSSCISFHFCEIAEVAQMASGKETIHCKENAVATVETDSLAATFDSCSITDVDRNPDKPCSKGNLVNDAAATRDAGAGSAVPVANDGVIEAAITIEEAYDPVHLGCVRHLTKEWLSVQALRKHEPHKVIVYGSEEASGQPGAVASF